MCWYIISIKILVQGPCNFDEVFFPTNPYYHKVIGSCYKVKDDARVTYDEVDDQCSDLSPQGRRAELGRSDEETNLILSFLEFQDKDSIYRYNISGWPMIVSNWWPIKAKSS